MQSISCVSDFIESLRRKHIEKAVQLWIKKVDKMLFQDLETREWNKWLKRTVSVKGMRKRVLSKLLLEKGTSVRAKVVREGVLS